MWHRLLHFKVYVFSIKRDLIEKFFIESQDPEDLMPDEYKSMVDFFYKIGNNLKRPRQDLKFGIR